MHITVALVSAALATAAFAGGRTEGYRRETDRPDQDYKYVFLTGSNIPQRVKVKRIGTTTASNLEVYQRRDIDQTGRTTVEGVLSTDPFLQVRPGRAGTGN